MKYTKEDLIVLIKSIGLAFIGKGKPVNPNLDRILGFLNQENGWSGIVDILDSDEELNNMFKQLYIDRPQDKFDT